MTDSYLSIAAIASDEYMTARLNACTTQQFHLGTIVIDDKWGDDATAPLSWVVNYRYVWAASPGWGEAWTYALDSHTDVPDYEPGQDQTVITDAMILSTVQTLAAPPPAPEEPDRPDGPPPIATAPDQPPDSEPK